MPKYLDSILKLLCLVLGALLVYQLARIPLKKDPLDSLSFTALASASAPAEKKPEPLATNAAPRQEPAPRETNSSARQEAARKAAASLPRRITGPKGADLPPAIQAQVERITQSEILGVVVRPLPMALLGIAGKDAFLRSPSGQTGLVREGEELGGIKLLRIGVNRVLIEHEQTQKELTIFPGLGSETLLPKGKAIPQ